MLMKALIPSYRLYEITMNQYASPSLRVAFILSCAFVIFLPSCVSLTPQKSQSQEASRKEQKPVSPQNRQVTWKDTSVSKHVFSRTGGAETFGGTPSAQIQNPTPKAPPAMVLIPAGDLLMGSKSGEGAVDETPQHKVYLAAYYIDTHEVTNAEYYEFWKADGGKTSKHTPASYGSSYMIGDWPDAATSKPNFPVVGITWYDAVAYAEWAGKRLPTEAEWEKAARGTDARIWPWGNSFNKESTSGSALSDGTSRDSASLACSNSRDGKDGYDNTTSPVENYHCGASPYGVYDMAGNVWQWTADIYHNTHLRYMRGGSYENYEYNLRVWARNNAGPDFYGVNVGFRCVRNLQPEKVNK